MLAGLEHDNGEAVAIHSPLAVPGPAARASNGLVRGVFMFWPQTGLDHTHCKVPKDSN